MTQELTCSTACPVADTVQLADLIPADQYCTPCAMPVTLEPPLSDYLDREIIIGCDSVTGQPIIQHIIHNTVTGAITDVLYFEEDGVTPVTNSANFTTAKDQLENEQQYVHITNTGAGQAEYGRVSLVKQINLYRNGVLDPTATTYWNTAVIPNIDVTSNVAALVAAGSQIDVAPVRKQLPEGGVALPTQTQTITGAANVALADIPQFATYAEVYIEAGAGDGGLRWTKDGTAPTDGSANEQEMTGTTIRLLDRDEIDNFRASVINLDTGDIDAALSATFKTVYWNVAPDED